MDIKRPTADINLNPAAGFEELMELLSLISACVGGLSFPFYLPFPFLRARHCRVCRITHAAVVA